MSVVKYVGEQGDDHAGQLHWPGVFGLPVRGGMAPTLRQEEVETGFEVVQDFRHQEFDLSDSTQAAEYNRVMDRIVNGWYIQLHKEVYRDGTIRKVYLEWSQRYGAMNPRLQERQSLGTTIRHVG